MNLYFSANIDRQSVFSEVQKYLEELGFSVINKDDQRPWGGFFVIDESQSDEFIQKFFPEVNNIKSYDNQRISPKILIVEPSKRLSWQYHHRRAELWRVIGGKVSIVTSDTDEEKNHSEYQKDSIITLKQGERHRLVGLDTWGVVAEIWQHTDAKNPSNEEDIIRVQDDFGR